MQGCSSNATVAVVVVDLLLSHPKGDLGFLPASPTPAGGAPPARSCSFRAGAVS